jgi:hypothetical protein
MTIVPRTKMLVELTAQQKGSDLYVKVRKHDGLGG